MEIFEFNDYRSFLEKKFKELKANDKPFSYQYIAKRLRTSKSYIGLVFQHKRHMSLDKLSEICDIFQLDKDEKQYLIMMFLENTSNNPFLKEHFKEIKNRIRPYLNILKKNDMKTTNDKSIKFLSILSRTLHSMSKMKGFKPNTEWILPKLNDTYPTQLVKSELQSLIKNKLIIKKRNKFQPAKYLYTQTNPYITNDTEHFSIGLLKSIDYSKNFDKYSKSHIYDMTLGLSYEGQEKALELYISLMKNLMDLSKNTKSSDVVMFTTNCLFTLADIQNNQPSNSD